MNSFVELVESWVFLARAMLEINSIRQGDELVVIFVISSGCYLDPCEHQWRLFWMNLRNTGQIDALF